MTAVLVEQARTGPAVPPRCEILEPGELGTFDTADRCPRPAEWVGVSPCCRATHRACSPCRDELIRDYEFGICECGKIGRNRDLVWVPL